MVNIIRMKNYQVLVIVVFVVASVNLCNGKTAADSWIMFVRDARTVFKSCPSNDLNPYSLWMCIKKGSLELFDRITSTDIIPLTEQIRLVRYRENDAKKGNSTKAAHPGFVPPTMKNNTLNQGPIGNEIDRLAWLNHVAGRSLDVLSTHAIQISPKNQVEGRARHRRNHMLPMMIFGMTALGMIMVPIGFQLLAMLGGKALLLSKMALLLASINGLKRVASSGIHYGLYHTDPHFQHPPWERSEQVYNRPRNMN